MPDNIYLQNYNIPEDGVLVEYRTTGEYTRNTHLPIGMIPWNWSTY